MSEEVGRELNNKLGRYIESDKRSWLSKQAKFIRIHVDLPIDKPLRKGGNIVNAKGEKLWFSFKYERLPNFCFHCNLLRHDEKHYYVPQSDSGNTRQYGDWLWANSSFKLSTKKLKVTYSGFSNGRKEDSSEDRHTLAQATSNSTDIEAKQAELPTIREATRSPTTTWHQDT